MGEVIIGGSGKGCGPSQLRYPTGLFLDHRGQIYVTDWKNNSVQRFSRE